LQLSENHLLNMEPVSRSFLIKHPVVSNSPISIHTLIYNASVTVVPSNSAKPPPAIIFLHYWGGSASTFHHTPSLVQDLYQRQESTPPTMISISFRGWGLSSPAVPDTPLAYSIGALAEDIIAILDQFQAEHLIPPGPDGLGEFVLCGHSMGAKVALKVAALLTAAPSSRPQGPRLRGLLLLAPAPPGPLVVADEVRAQMEHAYNSAENVRQTVRGALTVDGGGDAPGGGKRLEVNGDMEMIVRDSLAGSEGAKTGWLEVGMGEDIGGLLTAASQKMRDSGLKFRIMVALGDRVEAAERVEAETVNVLRGVSIPDVKYRLLEPTTNPKGEDYGHLLPLEAPQQVAAELLALMDDIARCSVQLV
jgi:3-oxoadipate enol-lactonase